jgi:hypothetical protein
MMKQFWSDLGGKLGVGLIGGGFLLIFLGWNGAASVDRVPSQFPYLISGGVGGLSLVVVGVGVLVVQNQRADRAELQATLQELRRALSDDEEQPVTAFEPPPPRPTPPQYAPAPPAVEVLPDGDDDDTRMLESAGGRRSRRKPLRAD